MSSQDSRIKVGLAAGFGQKKLEGEYDTNSRNFKASLVLRDAAVSKPKRGAAEQFQHPERSHASPCRAHPDQVRTYAARQARDVVLGARVQMRVIR